MSDTETTQDKKTPLELAEANLAAERKAASSAQQEAHSNARRGDAGMAELNGILEGLKERLVNHAMALSELPVLRTRLKVYEEEIRLLREVRDELTAKLNAAPPAKGD